METYNPKALNLEVLRHSKNKVTLGFKCNPVVKLTLAQEAERLGITLSELVENIVMNRNQLDNVKADTEALQVTVDELTEKINFYENDFLKRLFDDYKGKPVNFLDAAGETQILTVNDVTDIFTIIINSFKIKN